MKVRTKLLLVYSFLFLLIFLISVSAIFGFTLLGNGINRILKENYESVAASVQMMEALERQDSLTLTQLLSPTSESQAMQRLERIFWEALEQAKNNITIDKESAILAKVEKRYAQYREALDTLIARRAGNSLKDYQKVIYPPFFSVKNELQQLIVTNHQAMFEADQEAQRIAMNSASWLGLLIVFALLSVAFIFQWLNRDLVARLEEIHEVAESSFSDNPSRRVSVIGTDELSSIGIFLNKILDRQLALIRQKDSSLLHNRQILLGLLGILGQGFLVTGLDGRIIASTLSPEQAEHASVISSQIGRLHRELMQKGVQTRGDIPLFDDETISLRLLQTEPERPVGWLVKMV